MEVEPKSGVQLVELEEDGVVLGPQEGVQLPKSIGSLVEITLYALVGNPSTQTMKVKGMIRNHEMVSLIDFRNTHNFLDVVQLPNLKLPLDTSQILEVKVANGSIAKTLGICHGVTVLTQGYKFVVDFNVLHLGGCAVVLGIQWLCTLGEIIWDFKLLTMRFCYLGKEVFLQILHMSPSTFSEADKLFSRSKKKSLVLQIATVNSAAFGD